MQLLQATGQHFAQGAVLGQLLHGVLGRQAVFGHGDGFVQ